MNATNSDLSMTARRRLRAEVESFYDLQDVRIRVNHRIQNFSESEGLAAALGEKEYDRLRHADDRGVEFKALIRALKKPDHPKHEEYSKAALAAEQAIEGAERHNKINVLSEKQEALLKESIQAQIADHPVWTKWLSHVYGIGPILAAGLFAWIDIRKATHPSSLIKYAGLAVEIEKWVCRGENCSATFTPEEIPSFEDRKLQGLADGPARCPKCNSHLLPLGSAERRHKGQVANYNTKLKTHAFKIGQSFVKCSSEKSGYRRLYEDLRRQIEAKGCTKIHLNEKKEAIPCFDAHVFAKSTRATVKIFLSHLYRVWRQALDLPVSLPYSFGMLGHSPEGLIEPIYDEKNT